MLLIFTSQSALADSYPANVLGKLTNGVANVTFGVVEIPKTIFITSQSQGPAYGAPAGILMGMMQMVGVFDVATFIVPTKPLVTPVYIWNDFCTETSYSSDLQLR